MDSKRSLIWGFWNSLNVNDSKTTKNQKKLMPPQESIPSNCVRCYIFKSWFFENVKFDIKLKNIVNTELWYTYGIFWAKKNSNPDPATDRQKNVIGQKYRASTTNISYFHEHWLNQWEVKRILERCLISDRVKV